MDTEGKIVFIGHPASRPNLVQDFNDLLEGKPITGKGTTPAAGGDGDEDEEFKANVKAEEAAELVTKF